MYFWTVAVTTLFVTLWWQVCILCIHTKLIIYVGARLEMRALGKTTFRRHWRHLLPYYVICTCLLTDLCWECQLSNEALYRSANRHDSQGAATATASDSGPSTRAWSAMPTWLLLVLALKLLSITNHVVMTSVCITALTLLGRCTPLQPSQWSLAYVVFLVCDVRLYHNRWIH